MTVKKLDPAVKWRATWEARGLNDAQVEALVQEVLSLSVAAQCSFDEAFKSIDDEVNDLLIGKAHQRVHNIIHYVSF